MDSECSCSALGLILAFAVQDALDGINLTMTGYILAGAGVLVIVLTAVQAQPAAAGTRRSSGPAHADGSRGRSPSGRPTRTRRLPSGRSV